MLRRWLLAIRRDDDGQDLIEYTLLLGFLALVAAGIMSSVGTSATGPWVTAQTTIATAATATETATSSPVTPPVYPPIKPPGDGGHDHRGRD